MADGWKIRSLTQLTDHDVEMVARAFGYSSTARFIDDFAGDARHEREHDASHRRAG